jgi:hypothetical protein
MVRQEDLGDGIALVVFDSPGPVNTLGAADNVEFADLIDRLIGRQRMLIALHGLARARLTSSTGRAARRRGSRPHQALDSTVPGHPLQRQELAGRRPRTRPMVR